jgi:aldehyde:ferredoxin oxidoreductase
MIAPCYAGKILRVDLTTGYIEREQMDERVAMRFLGGKGFGARFLYEEIPPKIEPFDGDNKIVISTGPLTGTGAFSPKCNFASKSPSTGGWLDCTMGGYFGPELKYAGFDMLVISGKAREPVFISIHDDDVKILPAKTLWGKTSHEAELALKQNLRDPKTRVASIGPAGENLVRFACVNGDLYRQAGRGGMGSIWGSKNLKAVAVRGSRKVGFADRNAFVKRAGALNHYLKKNCAPLDTQGTMFLVDLINDNGMFPTRNFQELVFNDAKKINGEALVSTIKTRDTACHGCVVHCGNFVEVTEGQFGPFQVEGPEYETACLLGANCGVNNLEAIAHLNLLCDQLGLDSMSTGGTIAFAMECFQRGILTRKDMDGLELRWGDYKAMSSLIEKIAHRQGIGALLAEGSARAAALIGRDAERYAMHVKGLEIPGYDPRGAVGMALAYAVADRGGCHLRAWTIYDEVV